MDKKIYEEISGKISELQGITGGSKKKHNQKLDKENEILLQKISEMLDVLGARSATA